jgi:hypothetical protein
MIATNPLLPIVCRALVTNALVTPERGDVRPDAKVVG